MIPILIDTDNTILGNLTDCTACKATEERNGIYEAKFTVPMQSDIYSKIQTGRFISAKPLRTRRCCGWNSTVPMRLTSRPLTSAVLNESENGSFSP